MATLLNAAFPFLAYHGGSLFNGIAYTDFLALAGPPTLLFLVPVYVGMVLGGAAITLSAGQSLPFFLTMPQRNTVLLLAALHLLATVFNATSLFYAGPPLAQLIFSAGPLVAAAIQYVYARRKISWQQGAAILIIVAGLASRVALTSSGREADDDASVESAGADADDGALFFGIVCTFASLFLYTIGNIVGQEMLQAGDSSSSSSVPTIAPGQFLYVTGFCSLCLAVGVVGLWTIPRSEELAIDVAEFIVDPAAIRAAAYLCACQAAINVGFVLIVARFGAVTQSVLGGFNTIGTLLIAHAFECDMANPNDNCLTPEGTACAAVVVAGVLLYGLAPRVKETVSTKPKTE
jgi:hypothetical protein